MYDISKYRFFHQFSSIFSIAVTLIFFIGNAHAECVPQDAVPVCVSGVAASASYSAALIEDAGQSGLRKVRRGDKVDDWTVGEIGPRYVVFNRGDQSVRLDLTKDETKIAIETPTPPPAIKKGPVRHTRSLARGGS
jgi:hypothetical protein